MSLLSLHVNVLWSTRFTESVLVSITTSTRLLDIVSNFYAFEKFRHCCVTITFTIYSWMHCCSINLADFTSTACFRTRSSADADNRLDAFSGQSRSTNMVPFHMLHIVGLGYNYCICILQNFTGETKNVLY